MPDDRIPMTRDGYDKLKAELDRLRNVEMIEITKRVATAREMGDLSENAEYHAAREDRIRGNFDVGTRNDSGRGQRLQVLDVFAGQHQPDAFHRAHRHRNIAVPGNEDHGQPLRAGGI